MLRVSRGGITLAYVFENGCSRVKYWERGEWDGGSIFSQFLSDIKIADRSALKRNQFKNKRNFEVVQYPSIPHSHE